MKNFLKQIVVSILTAEARLLLWRHSPTIVAITGSVGKTSTKDAIYDAIKHTVPARKSQKSFNSEIGIPLTILGLRNGCNSPILWFWNIIDGAFTAIFSRKYPVVLVLETGVDTPGDMCRLTNWLTPDVVVLTRLPDVPVHVEYFNSPEAVIEEKMLLVRSLKDNGVLIYNHDDVLIKKQLPSVRQKAIGYSRYGASTVTAGEEQIYYHHEKPAGINFFVTNEQEKYELSIADVVGTQHLYAVSAALTVALHLGITASAAIEGLRAFVPPPGRMRVLAGIKDTTIIDDSYNSSPIAVEHALDTVTKIKHAKRRIAVLGDMLELGKYSTAEHERIGQQVAKTCDVLFTVGVRARGFALGAQTAGLDESVIFQYEHADRAGRELQNYLKTGDLVLVKGSQGIRTENIVKEIMNEPECAQKWLVRQDKEWLNKPV